MNGFCDRPMAWPDEGLLPSQSSSSSCLFEVLSGPSVTLWMAGDPSQETKKNLQLEIAPDRPVIIGRAEGSGVPYLDPAYRSTTLVPGTGDTILRGHGDRRDDFVSRAHFMLRGVPGGILLVNGVPRVGGGIRPPRNGTRLFLPAHRELLPGEAIAAESGDVLVIVLPNGTNIRLHAD